MGVSDENVVVWKMRYLKMELLLWIEAKSENHQIEMICPEMKLVDFSKDWIHDAVDPIGT